jgi:putative phosphoesterase
MKPEPPVTSTGPCSVIAVSPDSTMKIGIISDTHGLLRPEAIERLAGVQHIIHAGDIGQPEVIWGLRQIAPVTAIRGNVDRGAWAAEFPHTARVRLAGRSIHVLHDLKELDLDPVAAGLSVVVSGHSHRPKIETVGGVLYLNPGSAGPRRFTLPIALATLELSRDALRPCIHEVGNKRPGRNVSQALLPEREPSARSSS